MSKFDDIIDLPHHVSKVHKPMSLYDRSSQFAAFAALTGFDGAIAETGRRTTKKIILSEDDKDNLDFKLSNITKDDFITIRYFVKDELKSGGKYVDICGHLKKRDSVKMTLTMDDKTVIKIDDILDIVISK